jgi:S1-C subfamily serine protease
MKCVLRAISLFCAISLSAVAAGAAPLDDAVTAYDSGDYRQALARLRPLAEQRNAVAQFYLGIMHANGSGVPRDLGEAQRLYGLAAAQGHAPAQFSLGVMHLNGLGVPKDATEARKFYQQAAAQGHARAQYELALLYASGQGGAADNVQAHFWFSLAAIGFPESSGSDWRYKAQVQRGLAAAKMSPTEIAVAEQMVRSWKTTTSQQAAPSAPMRVASGSGFFVSDAGHVLTNAHVVAGCTTARAVWPEQAMAAEILARDARVDLALLKTERPGPAVSRLRPAVRQGEAVAVYGFPFGGVLSSGGSFTTGGVTALTGVRDDNSRLQITAPVQPGNSGGPLLDEGGNVVGVVVSRINAMRSDVAQNINFAIKASEATSFLDAQGVRYATGKLQARLSPSDIADRARAFSVRIECRPVPAAASAETARGRG